MFPLLPNGDEDEEEDDDDFDDCFLLSPFANGLVFGTPLLPPEKEGEFAPPLFLLLFGNPPLLDEPNPPNLFFVVVDDDVDDCMLLLLLFPFPNGFAFGPPLLPLPENGFFFDVDDDLDDCLLLNPFANGLAFGPLLLPPENEGELVPPLFVLLFENPPLPNDDDGFSLLDPRKLFCFAVDCFDPKGDDDLEDCIPSLLSVFPAPNEFAFGGPP